MFLVLIFLAVAAFAAYFFPEWSGVTVLLVSLASVVVLRILLAFSGRTR